MDNNNFYAELEAFDEFASIAEIDNYRVAPEDWYVVIADVRGSTRAIAEGRYKEVNMVGAACINAVLNISTRGQIPYVFGGDGATLLVPASELASATGVLLGVRELAASRFDLELRVGAVPVSHIHQHDHHRVMVGKYRLSQGNQLATFSGGGVELAESWIKGGDEFLFESSSRDKTPDLSGLSCRWEPLQAQNGVMLSLLMHANSDDANEQADLYRQLISDIDRITADSGKPVSDKNLKLRWPPRGIRAEIDATVGDRNRSIHALKLYANSLLQYLLDYFNLNVGGYRGRQYRVELRNNTDYRRFDDTLRILLDCSSAQADEIDAMLDGYVQLGRLRYGLHRSDSALMTCLVFNLDKGEHVHFVDGSDGGFTSAAKNLKSKAAGI